MRKEFKKKEKKITDRKELVNNLKINQKKKKKKS